MRGKGKKNSRQNPEQNTKRKQARIDQKIKDAKIIAENLDKLEGWLESADENGLFKKDSNSYKSIVADMCAARKELDNDVPKTIEAYEKLCSASHVLNQSINSSTFGWRFKYSYGGPVVLYLLAVLASLLLAWIFFSDVISDSKILWLPSWAFFLGYNG